MNSSERQTLPREIILKKKYEIDRVLRLGKRNSSRYFTLFVYQSGASRVAFLVSKRTGSATQRNRMKRLFREAYRHNRGLFTGKEVVFYIKEYFDNYQKICERIKAFSE